MLNTLDTHLTLEMSFANSIDWTKLSDDDLKAFEKLSQTERDRRDKEKENTRKLCDTDILLKIWPDLSKSGVINDSQLEKNRIVLFFTPSPSFNLYIDHYDPINGEADEPPYIIRLEKYKDEKYALHIDLNSAR